MMSLKIRLLSLTIGLLARYQQHLETQRWLKQQRQQSWQIEGVSAHIAKDIGVDPDGRIRGKLDELAVENPQHQQIARAWQRPAPGLTADT
jgi:hypothetical protein